MKLIIDIPDEMCGDCVSRKSVMQIANELLDSNVSPQEFKDMVDTLPPATPKLEECEDCISREETLTAFADYVASGMSMNDYEALWDIVAKMPPVQPKQRTG